MNGKVVRFEENGFYYIEAYPEMNHLRIVFLGELKKNSDIPNYVRHIEEAVALMSDYYTALTHVQTEKNPGFSITTTLKDGLKKLKGKKVHKIAFYSARKNITHKMIVKVLEKLSDISINIFESLTEAENWLGMTEEQRKTVADYSKV
jgi:hypothetical protein